MMRGSSASDYTSLRTAVTELFSMLGHLEQWGSLAWNDVKLRYRRTTFGPLWITLGLGATVFSVGIVYGGLFGNAMSQYLPYFATGLIAWTFLATALTEGCSVYLLAAGVIKAIPAPPVVHVYRMLARQLIMLGHNLLLLVALWLMFLWPLNSTMLLVVPGIALNTITVFGLVLALSIVAARFRDVQLILATILQLVFLMTPIMWEPQSLRGAALKFVADFNPFHHLIEIVRRPMLGQLPAPESWILASLTATVALVVGITAYARHRHRIPFWV